MSPERPAWPDSGTKGTLGRSPSRVRGCDNIFYDMINVTLWADHVLFFRLPLLLLLLISLCVLPEQQHPPEEECGSRVAWAPFLSGCCCCFRKAQVSIVINITLGYFFLLLPLVTYSILLETVFQLNCPQVKGASGGGG